MNDQIESQTERGNQLDHDGDTKLSRRRLLKAGVSAAPVILTLASRPVLAWHCKPPSAYASANLSGRTQQTWTDENTKTISDWISASNWPSPYVKSDITNQNGQVITRATTMAAAGLGTSTDTMLSHLQNGTQLEKYLIAALLNICMNANIPSYCLRVSDVQDMFRNGPTGSYSPPDSPGIHWGSAQIIDYLQKNWIVIG